MAARFVCSGTYTGDWLGHRQPDDSSGACPRCTSSNFTDGRIIKAWGLEDTYLRLRQLGLL